MWQSGYAARRNCGFDYYYYYYYYYCITPLAGVETTCHWLLAACQLLVRSLFAVCLLAVCCLHACLIACLLAACLLVSGLFVICLLACLLAGWSACINFKSYNLFLVLSKVPEGSVYSLIPVLSQ